MLPICCCCLALYQPRVQCWTRPATSCMQRAVTSGLCCCLQGVGSHAAHLLLRSGVGRLRLVDFDQVIPVSNHDISSCAEGLARSDLPMTDPWLDQCSTHACSPYLQSGCLSQKQFRWSCCSAPPPAPLWTGAQVMLHLWACAGCVVANQLLSAAPYRCCLHSNLWAHACQSCLSTSSFQVKCCLAEACLRGCSTGVPVISESSCCRHTSRCRNVQGTVLEGEAPTG